MDNWPRNRLEPPIAATLKERPEDFIVQETLAFLPSGEGEHCYVQLEKSGLSTPELAGQLADLHGLAGQDVGYAGMKDKHAITSQWFSLRGVATLSGAARELAGVRVLQESRHAQKLRRGQICANRFEILLRELGPGNLESALDRLATEGAPNYFGSQRFGWDNLQQATSWLARRRSSRISRFRRGLYLSVLRSYLFNEVLAARVERKSWCAPIDGDVLVGKLPTGPLWGRGRSPTGGAAAAIESSALEPHTQIMEGLEYAGVKQDRRRLQLIAEGFSWVLDGDNLTLGFSLPPGGYATSLLREIFRWRTASETVDGL